MIVYERGNTRVVRHSNDGGFLTEWVIEHRHLDAMGQESWHQLHRIPKTTVCHPDSLLSDLFSLMFHGHILKASTAPEDLHIHTK